MSAATEGLAEALDRAFAAVSQARQAFAPRLTLHEVGTITSVSTGVAKVAGLPGVGFEEPLDVPAGKLQNILVLEILQEIESEFHRAYSNPAPRTLQRIAARVELRKGEARDRQPASAADSIARLHPRCGDGAGFTDRRRLSCESEPNKCQRYSEEVSKAKPVDAK